MKYLVVIDDSLLDYFAQDRSKANELVMIVNDLRGSRRGIKLKPIIRPIILNESGENCYINDDHIRVLMEYEERKAFKSAIEEIRRVIDDQNNRK